MKSRSGFSFLEILVVLVILAVLSLLAIPRMGETYRQNQLNSSAREITACLRQARNIAIAMNDGCEVWFNPETAEYQVQPVHLDTNGLPVRERRSSRDKDDGYQPDGETTRVRILPGRVFFTLLHSNAPERDDNFPSVLFYPDGSATAAFLGVQNTDNLALSIQVYRTTGKVVVATGDPVLPENVIPLFYLPEKIQYAPITRPGG